jgi:hypothetical protein
MVEMVIYFDDGERKRMGVMAGTPSNFFPFAGCAFCFDDELANNAVFARWKDEQTLPVWMVKFLAKRFVSPEDLIQTLKILAATSSVYGLDDETEEAIAKSLASRAEKLGELGASLDGRLCKRVTWCDGSEVFATYRDMNARVASYLADQAVATVDPKRLKALGNACGLKSSFFKLMDGKPEGLSVTESVYEGMGNNARVMLLGLLMRLYSGDMELVTFLELCAEYALDFQEMAMHVAVGKNETHGGFPDTHWGAAWGDCRVGPDTHLVREQGGVTYNAFGNGGMALLDLIERDSAAAKGFAGIPVDACCFQDTHRYSRFLDMEALQDALAYVVVAVLTAIEPLVG